MCLCTQAQTCTRAVGCEHTRVLITNQLKCTHTRAGAHAKHVCHARTHKPHTRHTHTHPNAHAPDTHARTHAHLVTGGSSDARNEPRSWHRKLEPTCTTAMCVASKMPVVFGVRHLTATELSEKPVVEFVEFEFCARQKTGRQSEIRTVFFPFRIHPCTSHTQFWLCFPVARSHC